MWGARARDWSEVQEPLARPLYETVFGRAGMGPWTGLLDVGCGAGLACRIAASRGAHVTGVDASEELLAVARARLPNADFRQADLEELPFADGSFDLVTSFNALQYAGNPGAALAEAARVLRYRGVVAIATWGVPEGMEAASVVGALRPLLPPPPPGAPGPFALSDEKALRAFASGAGLTPGEIFDVNLDFAYPDEATAIRGLNSAGVAVRAIEQSGEGAVSEAHAKAIAPFRRPDGSYRFKASFRCLFARPK